jgi:Ser/Thr protein kinase RdoA (MazF antagonist)
VQAGGVALADFASLGLRGQVSRLEQMARVALRNFDLPPADLKPLAHMQNTTFRVTAGDQRYVLRIHPPGDMAGDLARSVPSVRSEMEWLTALRRDTALVVPEPVPTREGALVIVVETEEVPEPRM